MTTTETRLLHKRLEHARLARMLHRMHVSEDVYLQRLHPDTIKAQVDTCVACPHQFLCDPALACKRSTDVDLSFCPNREAVRALARA